MWNIFGDGSRVVETPTRCCTPPSVAPTAWQHAEPRRIPKLSSPKGGSTREAGSLSRPARFAKVPTRVCPR